VFLAKNKLKELHSVALKVILLFSKDALNYSKRDSKDLHYNV